MQLTTIDSSQYLTYLRLQHPAVLDGATYVEAKHKMTDFVCGTSYQNLPWVVAEFADGSKWAYYGDPPVLVGALRDGVVLDGLTSLAKVAEHFQDMLTNVSGLTLSVETAGATRVVDIKGVAGASLAISDLGAESSAGVDKSSNLRLVNVSDGTDGTAGTPASGVLLVMYVNSGGVVNDIYVGNDTDGWTQVMESDSITVGASDDAEDIAGAIATAINAYAPLNAPDYKASSVGRTVYITTEASVGGSSNGFKIKTVVTGPVVFTDCGFQLNGSGSEQVTALTAGATPLISAAVTRVGTDAAWAQAVVDAVNALTGTSGYVAASYASTAGGVFIIGKKTTIVGDATVTVSVTTSAGTVVAVDVPTTTPEAPPLDVQLTAQVASLPYKLSTNINYPKYYRWQGTVDPQIFVVVGGGNGNYTGVWSRVSGSPYIQMDANSPWYQPLFRGDTIVLGGPGQGVPFPIVSYWRLDVEDTSVPKKTASVTIQVYGYIQ